MTRTIDRAEFQQMVTSFERSAWRWECQGEYYEPGEAELVQRWREGSADYSFLDGWRQRQRTWRAEGKTWQRVRMVTDPPTDYLRWMLDFTHLAVEAGDDIRWMDEADARRLEAPTDDFYLLDDNRLVIMHFDHNGVSGATIEDDPAAIAQAQRWREIAWANAVPHHEYLSAIGST